MKKFLTFFALLCALLGFSVPISAADTYNDPGALYFFNGSSHPMTKVGSDYIYTVDATSADIYGVFTNQNTTSWDTAKNSNNCYIPVGAKNGQDNGKDQNFEATSLNGTWLYTWDIPWANNSIHFPKGKVYEAKVTYDSTNRRFKATVSDATYPTLYFRGEQTGSTWPALESYKFSRSGNIYTLTVKGGIGSGAWKIADSGWSVGSCWGAPTGQTATLSNGVAYSLTKKTTTAANDPGDLKCNTNGKDATITFTYNPSGTSTVKVDWSEGDIPVTGAPYIFINGSAQPFVLDGSNWVYSIDATDADVQFRLQNDKNVTVPLLSDFNSNYGNNALTNGKVLSGGNGPISESCTRQLYAYSNGGYDYKVIKGGEYILSIPKSAPSNFNNCTLTVTKLTDTPSIVRSSNTDNFVTIKARSSYDLHYTINGEPQPVANADVRLAIPAEGLTVTAWYTKIGDSTAVGEIAEGTFAYYEAPQQWPIKKWSLSDNTYFHEGTYKYFYMSRFQNDDRVSPEWELIDEGNGKYALRNFMVIPAGEFRIRRIYKAPGGALSYTDFGLDTCSRLRLTTNFGVSADNVALEEKEYTASLSLSQAKSRGYAWDMGYTMASIVVTHSTDGTLSVEAIADFTKPSTFNGAPIAGMPVVALTSSNLRIPTIEGQTVQTAATLDSSHPEYNTAFTNAWIQYDEDSNMLVYGDDISGDGGDNTPNDGRGNDNKEDTNVYFGDSHHRPHAGKVMNSTILPPRYPVIFKLVDFSGNETRITSDKIILKYNEERSSKTRNFTAPDKVQKTKEAAKFAVYELKDIEMAGLYKIYSGYGAHKYGSVENGLSLFSNWGVGHQPSDQPYAGATIESGQAYPLNGGGPKTDSKGYSWRDGGNDTNGWYDKEDNWAGRYFEFGKRTYVSKLNFFYALERDQEGANGTYTYLDGWDSHGNDNYNSHHAHKTDNDQGPHWNQPNVTNDGVNYSWFNMTYDGSIGRVLLAKIGANTGRVTYSINDFVDNPGEDPLHKYEVHLIKIDNKTGEPITGEDAFDRLVDKGDLNGATVFSPEPVDEHDLTPGWYVAKFIFYSDTHDEDTGEEILNKENILYSTRIYVYGIEGAKITAKQRTSTDTDGKTLYHPVIEVTPDASAAIAGLVSDTPNEEGGPSYVDMSEVFGKVEVAPISSVEGVTRFYNPDGELPTSAEEAGEGKMYVEFDYANSKATVHYPVGFFKEDGSAIMNFVVRNAAISRYTTFTLTIDANGAATAAKDNTSVLVYMPAAKLDGQIVADKREDKFNALRLVDADDATEQSGVITYVDSEGQICGVDEVDETAILAQVIYGVYDEENDKDYIDLTEIKAEDGTTTKKLANMKALTEGVKRYAVGAIPYMTDNSSNGEKIRKDQEVPFTVNLTYSVEGYEDAAVNGVENVLDYAATNLTAPRDGIKDIRSESDAANMGTGGIATDVTTLTDSYVENYGGLFTNIEDAHVALQAKEKNEELVGNDDFNLWTMDHGQYFPQTAEGAYPAADTTRPNPFSPLNHLAITQNNPDGGTAAAANEVHPLLREDGNKVVNEDSFKNNESVNNAWWNQRAQIAPAFHVDHISGTLKWDKNGVISFSNEGGKKPEQHRNFWAGVIPTNDQTYDAEWNGGKLELPADADANPNDTDAKPTTYVHDPTHGYYDSNNHHTAGRSAYKMGEIPLNLNDILCLIGTGKKDANGQPTGEFSDYYNYQYGQYLLENGEDLKAAIDGLNKMHGYDQIIFENAGYKEACKSVMVDGVSRDLSFDQTKWWYLDKVWNARAEVAFNDKNSDLNMSPAEFIFRNFNNHMIFKVNHVNHESWFVPGAYYPILQHDYRTRPIWPAFESSSDFKSKKTDEERDNWVMNQLRMNLSDYCPLEYYARYSYPFLTSKDYVAGEDMGTEATAAQSRSNRVPAKQGTIEAALKAVNVDNDVTPVVAPSYGRVPFYGATTPDNVVPTAISNVSDDNISGNGFSIVYNRAAGTVTVTAFGDRELKDAAVYDISGSSMIHGASADRVNDQTIVLDVRGIAQGAYIVSTNLGGAKFMK